MNPVEQGTPRDKQWLEEMCQLVRNKMPGNYSFVVFGFPNSGTDRCYYASNTTRDSAIEALKQWIAHAEAGRADFGRHS